MNHCNRLSSLDTLRGIAAIGVAIFWHYQHFKPEYYPFATIGYWFYNYGWNLVDFFFVLSGFIFSYVYIKNISTRQLTFYKYSVSRLSRLYPLHLITLILVVVIQLIRHLFGHHSFVYSHTDLKHLLLNLFFVQAGWFPLQTSFNGPAWSISCEIIAYLLFFVFIYYFHENNKFIMFFIGLIFIGVAIIKLQWNVYLFNEAAARVLIGFFTGCMTYQINEFASLYKFRKLLTIIVSLQLITIATVAFFFGNKSLGDWAVVYTLVIYPAIIIVVLNISSLNSLLSIKPLTYLGDISYSIYLWHFPIQAIIKTFDDLLKIHINYSTNSFFVLFVSVVLLVSILSYELLEKPVSKYLRNKLLIRSDSFLMTFNTYFGKKL